MSRRDGILERFARYGELEIRKGNVIGAYCVLRRAHRL